MKLTTQSEPKQNDFYRFYLKNTVAFLSVAITVKQIQKEHFHSTGWAKKNCAKFFLQ